MDDFYTFQRFLADVDYDVLKSYYLAAKDKLETLYPTKRIMPGDFFTIKIESDCLYCEDGFDYYDIGLVDDEYPAMCRRRDSEIVTFRV